MPRRYGAGTVYQRADGKWSAQWSAGKDDTGRRIRGTVTADTEAAAWKALAAARPRSSSGTRRKRGGESVGAYLERWLRDVVKPTKRERTYWGYRQIVDRHLVPAFGDRPLAGLTRREVQAWINRQDAPPLTVRHRLDCLRGALSRAVRWGLIDVNPAKDIDLPAVAKRTIRAVSHDDVRAILAACEGSDIAPLVTVALYTGLRQGELLGLRWEDVNLGRPATVAARDRGAIDERQAPSDRHTAATGPDAGGAVPADDRGAASLTVHHSLARLPGPHGYRYVLTEPKSARSRRTVPLAPPAVEALRAQRIAALEGAANAHSLVFARPDGRPHDGPRITKAFQAQLAAARISLVPGSDPPRTSVRFHDLRHYTASLLLSEGVPMQVVSAILGHSNIGVTVDIYGHLSEQSKREAVSSLTRALG